MNGPRPASKGALVGALAVVVLGLVASGPGLACTCIPQAFEVEYANTSHVFTAHQIGSHTAAPEYPDHHWEVLAVHAVWKGAVAAVVEVLAGDDDGMCGLRLQPDREYLIFARENGAGGPLFTHSCSRTGSYPSGDPIWALLGPPVTLPALPSSWGRMKASYR